VEDVSASSQPPARLAGVLRLLLQASGRSQPSPHTGGVLHLIQAYEASVASATARAIAAVCVADDALFLIVVIRVLVATAVFLGGNGGVQALVVGVCGAAVGVSPS
jgi:hypothetical protein